MNRRYLSLTLVIIGYLLTLLFLWLPYTTIQVISTGETKTNNEEMAYVFQDNAYIPTDENLEIIELNFNDVWELGAPKYVLIFSQTLLFLSIMMHQSKKKGIMRVFLILFTLTFFGYLFFYFPNTNFVLIGSTQIQNLHDYEVVKASVFLPSIVSLMAGFILLLISLGFAIENEPDKENQNKTV